METKDIDVNSIVNNRWAFRGMCHILRIVSVLSLLGLSSFLGSLFPCRLGMASTSAGQHLNPDFALREVWRRESCG